jgi:hypothetical protein
MVQFSELPTFEEYLQKVERDEREYSVEEVNPQDIRMQSDGEFLINDRRSPVSDIARKSIYKAHRIPRKLMARVPTALQACVFNHISQNGLFKSSWHIVRNGIEVSSIETTTAVSQRFSPVIQKIIESAPREVRIADLRVIVHGNPRGQRDISIICNELAAQPLPDDLLYGGVCLSMESSGEIQIGAATWRLVCRNGMVRRECHGGRHRIRRGSEAKTLEAVGVFASSAWSSFHCTANAVASLAQQPISDPRGFVAGLRRAPFHVSNSVAENVERQMFAEANGDAPTLYNLWNALTHVGTHDGAIPPQYSYRLRLGAGALTQTSTRVCSGCQRLLLSK